MSARAIWKARVRVADVDLPVKLYSAVQDQTVHFHLLHDRDHVRVRQRMVDPRTDEEVPPDDRRKALEVEPNTFVLLGPEELDRLTPETSREIEITGFVDPAEVEQSWHVRPYWLGPDGDPGEYFALAQALEEEKLEGLAHWVMRNKRYDGVLRAEAGHLMLITLHRAAEVVARERLDAPEGRSATAQERELAGKLVEALAGPFDAEEWHDTYRERVMELIEAKSRGETVEVIELPRRPEAASLAEALEQSLAKAG